MARQTAQQNRTKDSTERRLAALRARIARIGAADDGYAAAAPLVALGCGDIDRHLPGGGLARGALHEIVAADSGAAALGFALWIVARMTRKQAWLWCAQESPQGAAASMPCVPALADFGLAPRRLLLARTMFERETLWAAEEGLATPALGAVLAEAAAVSDIAARRLMLAARTSGVPLILLRPAEPAADLVKGGLPAASRWRVGGAPDGAWEIALMRAAGVFPRRWRVAWRGSEGPFPIPVPTPAADHDHDDLQADHEARDAARTRALAAPSIRGAA